MVAVARRTKVVCALPGKQAVTGKLSAILISEFVEIIDRCGGGSMIGGGIDRRQSGRHGANAGIGLEDLDNEFGSAGQR